MEFKQASAKFAGTTAKLKNTLRILETCVGNQVIERGILIETLTVLLLAESIIVSLRRGCT